MLFSPFFSLIRTGSFAAVLATLIPMSVFAAADATSPAPPRSWVDADTSHRVIQLTSEPGSGSLYFTDNAWTPDGRQMIYTAAGAIRVLDITTLQTRPLVPGPVRAIMVG